MTDLPSWRAEGGTIQKQNSFDETYLYTYDHVGRKTKVQHRFGTNAWKTIGQYAYDELGRLAKRTPLTPSGLKPLKAIDFGDLGDFGIIDIPVLGQANYAQTYQYHIQGGLKQMSSDYYSETLYRGSERETSLGSLSDYKAVYNGLIAGKSMTYKSGTSSLKSRYAYRYDGLGRLTDAFYVDNTRANFSVRNIRYDKHGNIQSLMRYGITHKVGTPPYVTGLADDLHYSYLGNQLMRITELATQIPYAGMQTFDPMILNNRVQNQYNANGSLAFDATSERRIEYNILNLPSEVKTPIGIEQSFVYDVAGKKVAEHSYFKSIRRTYADNVIYQDGQAVYIGLEEGYYANGAYFATISDYQGSIVMVLKTTGSTNGSSEILERNHYDPWGVEFGMASDVAGIQPYKHQGKERLEFAGTGVHDHGARMAHNAIGRWTVMDPLMEKYYPVSPYVYCGNNPVSFVDPDGRDVWEIDIEGRITNRIEDETQDAFFMVEKDADGNYQRTFETDDEGNKVYNSISFEYGTVESQRSISFSPDGKTADTYDVYQVRGDENGTELFEFFSNNVSGSITKVEFSHIMTGVSGDEGLNFVSTSHMKKADMSMPHLFNTQLVNGYSIREMNHSHPEGMEASTADKNFARGVLENTKYWGLPSPKFSIYNVKHKIKFPYQN